MKKFETGLFHDTWPSKLYPGILGMRLALLQSREPEKWKKFLKLRSFKNCGHISTWTTELESLVRSSIVDFMAQERTVYQDWVMDLFRVFFIDSYQLPALEGTRCVGLRVISYFHLINHLNSITEWFINLILFCISGPLFYGQFDPSSKVCWRG